MEELTKQLSKLTIMTWTRIARVTSTEIDTMPGR